VQINPIVRSDVPKTARDIINRVNEISFNSSLIKELRSIHLLHRLIESEGLAADRYRNMFLHLIHADVELQDLEASSKMNAEWDYLRLLHGRGRAWAESWLGVAYDSLGRRSTLDLDALFEDTFRPVPETRRGAE